MLKLNLGCGQIRPEGWYNADSSINSFVQRLPFGKILVRVLGAKSYDSNNLHYMNLNREWRRFKDSSVSVVYASHLYEHLSLKSAELYLKESYRVLNNNGAIRIVVPDLEALSRDYLENLKNGNTNSIDQYMWALNLHIEGQYPKGKFAHNLLGRFQGFPHQHKFMYDSHLLTKLLSNVGFRDIKILDFGISEYIESIKDVEFDPSRSYNNSIYIEATK